MKKGAHLFIMNLACRFCLISSTLFIASTVKIKSWHFRKKPHDKSTSTITLNYSWPHHLSFPRAPCYTSQVCFCVSQTQNSYPEREHVLFIYFCVYVNTYMQFQMYFYFVSSHHCQLLSCSLSECFGPSGFSWVSLLLEVFDTFWSAESECLHWQRKHMNKIWIDVEKTPALVFNWINVM